jgi:hypothetical protein
MTNGADHERIWLQPKCCAGEYEGRQWCQDNVFDDGECEGGAKATEYVRADLAATRTPAPSSDIEELVEARQKLGALRRMCESCSQPLYVEILNESLPVVARAYDTLLAIQGRLTAFCDIIDRTDAEGFTPQLEQELINLRAALTATG